MESYFKSQSEPLNIDFKFGVDESEKSGALKYLEVVDVQFDFPPVSDDGIDKQISIYNAAFTKDFTKKLKEILGENFDVNKTRVSFLHRSNIDYSQMSDLEAFKTVTEGFEIYLDVYNKSKESYEQFSLQAKSMNSLEAVVEDYLLESALEHTIEQELISATYTPDEWETNKHYIADIQAVNRGLQNDEKSYINGLESIKEAEKNLPFNNNDPKTIEIISSAESQVAEQATESLKSKVGILAKLSEISESIKQAFNKPMPKGLETKISVKAYNVKQEAKGNFCQKLFDDTVKKIGNTVKAIMNKAGTHKFAHKVINALEKIPYLSNTINDVVKSLEVSAIQNDIDMINKLNDNTMQATGTIYTKIEEIYNGIHFTDDHYDQKFSDLHTTALKLHDALFYKVATRSDVLENVIKANDIIKELNDFSAVNKNDLSVIQKAFFEIEKSVIQLDTFASENTHKELIEGATLYKTVEKLQQQIDTKINETANKDNEVLLDDYDDLALA